MSSERLLGTLLRSIQTPSSQQDTPRLLSTAASLLTSLSNPLNLSLLTGRLLTSPAFWEHPDGLRTCLGILGVFHSASRVILNHEHTQQGYHLTTLNKEEWVKAVARGADEKSPRWKHTLVLGGLLLGFESHERQGLPAALRRLLEGAIVKASNLALVQAAEEEQLGTHCIGWVLNHTFDLLPEVEKAAIDYDLLLPVLINTAFASPEGLRSGYFLGVIDVDVSQVKEGKFTWPATSSTFKQIQQMSASPILSSLGSVSRLIAHSIANVRDPALIRAAMEELFGFSRTLLTQWRQNKLSQIDVSEESIFLENSTMTKTLPVLWQTLKAAMFAIIIVLNAAIGRMLSDPLLATDDCAPLIASQTLHSLRNLYFLSSRLGATSLSQHVFVFLAAIDILSRYPMHVEAFLSEIQPAELGNIPRHPLDRCLDLFFLNTAEHFTLVISPKMNEDLLIASAIPYLASGGNNNLLEIFEAAHSVMLAVLAAPQSASIASNHLPFYVDALFKVFPRNLSPRQFRLAFKTLLQITTPPSPLSASQPQLPSILLEIVHQRAITAPSTPLVAIGKGSSDEAGLSEQGVLVLTLIDALPFLGLEDLEEWLSITASLAKKVQNSTMQEMCKRRFWEVLSNGEMDVTRAELCVTWWGTRGGRELLMFGSTGSNDGPDGPYMSGAVDESRESKL
ncbi:putative peroxisomal membrane protein Pex17 [Xylona heveae TC161]|uniref:Putative peroxisomal membrane protein Pex17 n=1 Tax=Xylona heveae (strain CBS 132557 / TC161) TaxID=1328760 RepID=A0A165G060_XYLHT|nr:putative peroxisomal membrane protein Pex17 [Xylona heveae TC161]KZF21586.1 putative peroxisomal membrane protein Pex17 [Xylona heveae TC161]